MAKSSVSEPATGVWVTRNAGTGLTEVRTAKGTSRASAKSSAAVKEISSRRSEALARLADR